MKHTLPLVGGPPQLRADAARNHGLLLEAATRLVAEHGVANLTLRALASAAGVGKATVSRRFGSRAGLIETLLDHQEQQLQAAYLFGPPPLGPGASALDRLRAFGPAVMGHERAHRDLYLAHTNLTCRHAWPAHRLRMAHVTMLLGGVGPDGDAEVVAAALLGYLDPALVDDLLTRRGMTVERMESGWLTLVARLATGTTPHTH